MADLNKLFVGQKVPKFPAKTFNQLIAGEVRDRAISSETRQSPPPAIKSPLHVRLLWEGTGSLDPGACVKLGDVLFEPADDESVPFSALAFRCDEFGADESSEPYAITLGPIADPADGANEAIGWGICPNMWWAKVDVGDADHTHAKPPASGTLLESGTSGLKIVWKPTDTGEQWCVVLIGGGANSALRWGPITTSASAASTQCTPTTDGRMTLCDDFGGTEDVELTNYYPDIAPINAIGCIDANNVLVTWSCGTITP